MNNRIVGLLGLLVLLIIIAYASGTFDSAPSTIDVPSVEIVADEVSEILVNTPTETIRVAKTNGIWQMLEPVNWMADSASINSFAESLGNLKLESVVSTNPERYGRYGVDTSGTVVTVTTSSESRDLTIAASGPDFMTGYVRLADDPRVFVSRPKVSPPTSADRWRDKMVTAIPAQVLTAVRVTSDEHSYELNRGDEGWQLSQNSEETAADSVAVSRYLQNFGRLRADGFLTDTPPVDANSAVVELQIQTGETMTFRFTEVENDLALDYSGEPRATFKLFTSRRNTLVPAPDSFVSN